MKTNITLDRNMIAVAVDETVHVMVELTAPAAPAARSPIDVVAVVDRSSSMDGEPIRSVRDALGRLSRLLTPDDRLGVVTFADEAQEVLPLAGHDTADARRSIEAIRARGSTNLSAGMFMGLDMLSAARSSATKALVVLSDGHVNRGLTDPATLADVCTRAAGEAGVRTTTIGFGQYFDEALMGLLADHGGGDSHWCKGPEDAEQIYRQEFTNLVDIAAQNLTVTVTPRIKDGSLRVLNGYPMVGGPDRLTIQMGDAYAGETRTAVMAFDVPGLADMGDVEVAELELGWIELGAEIRRHQVRFPVMVTTTDDPDEVPALDRRVHEEVLVLGAAKTREEALELARDGSIPASRRALARRQEQLAKEAAESGSERLAEEAGELAEEIDLLDAGWDETTAKTLWSASRTRSRSRRTRPDDPN